MKCLLVIDMQEDYVGVSRNIKKYPYKTKELIHSINNRIAEYPQASVIYIVNKFFWEIGKKPKRIVEGLLVVSNHVFEKRKASCFTNNDLLEHLKKINASELELVGVDGNYCVGATAIDGISNQFTVIVNESLVGVGNNRKFVKTKKRLEEAGVMIVS